MNSSQRVSVWCKLPERHWAKGCEDDLKSLQFSRTEICGILLSPISVFLVVQRATGIQSRGRNNGEMATC